ncbi:MAG TPA: NAD(P)-dependent oxidoreductase [Gammaproteobacteria bacterium]|nr:NAD(P)-dependent oxidoreductase [Gammaproteobacteria bacterium]
MARLAFIGLGVMGFPMAGHLARAGHAVTVYNRTAATRERWLASYAGEAADSPAAAADGAEVVFSCVGNDEDLRAVTVGPRGSFEALRPGAVHVDHSTSSALVARELAARAKAQGAGFIDAPVSGGQSGAERGVLSCMCGGEAADYAKVEALLSAYAASARLLGPSGAGQLTKMVNQICIAGLLQGLAEGLAFGRRAGLDMPAVLSVIGKGAAQSWQMDNRATTMLEGRYDFGFAVDWMRKDLGIVLDEARRNGARLPVTALVDQFYATLQAQGLQRADASSLMALLAEI